MSVTRSSPPGRGGGGRLPPTRPKCRAPRRTCSPSTRACVRRPTSEATVSVNQWGAASAASLQRRSVPVEVHLYPPSFFLLVQSPLQRVVGFQAGVSQAGERVPAANQRQREPTDRRRTRRPRRYGRPDFPPR